MKKLAPWKVTATPGVDDWGFYFHFPDFEGNPFRVDGSAKRVDQIEEAAEKLLEFHVYDKGHSEYAPVEVELTEELRYTPDPFLRDGWIVDIDGTLASHAHRGPYEMEKLGTDEVNVPVFEVVRALYAASFKIILVSGRDSKWRPDTIKWLRAHSIPHDALFMRGEGDMRGDDIVKLELFNRHIRRRYRVFGAIDDRNRCVLLWRLLGLTCLQAAPGDF